MRFLDLFAGVGGFRRGLELAGHECVGFCEWDKFAAASYTSMHLITEEQRNYLATLDIKQRQKEILKEEYRNGEWYSADVRLIRYDNVPTADCWCFGAPCQDFSVAGKRAGLDGDKSSLVREVFRILREHKEEYRPELLIYENVKGMLSSNRGGDFGAIILEMGELGYDIEWELFNSKNFGAPQNRDRVYTVGHLRSRGERKIFPLKGADGENSVCEVNQIGMQKSHRTNPNQYRLYDTGGISPCLNTMDGGGREPHIPVMFGIDKNVQGSETECANALTAREDRGVSNFKQTGTSIAVTVGYDRGLNEITTPESQTRRGRVGKKVAQTLDCGCNQGIIVKLNENTTVYAVWYEKYQCYIAIRKLTPRECFRLQGWTDDYFDKAAFVNSDSQLYKQAGNGVTVNVVQAIGEAIKEASDEKP